MQNKGIVMRSIPNELMVILTILTTCLPIGAHSSTPIDFSDINTVNELILNKIWSCKMVDNYGESVGVWKFKSVKGNKVRGSIEVPHLPICNTDTLKGKLKKNILKYNASINNSCREVNGVLKFDYDDNNQVKATGKYKIGGTHKGGSYVCELQN